MDDPREPDDALPEGSADSGASAHPENSAPVSKLPEADAAPQPPARGPRIRHETYLVLALVLSLGLNAMLAVQTNDATSRAAAAEKDVADLRRKLTELGADDPTSDGPFVALESAVERLRGLRFRSKITPALVSRAELEKEIEESFEGDAPAAELRAAGRTLAAFGLLSPDDDMFEIVRDGLAADVAGFYDDSTGRLVALADDARVPSPLTRVTLAHEFTHALTYQHFELVELEERLSDEREDDASTALLSLIEGDATWVMDEYARTVLTPQEQASYAADGLRFEEELDTSAFPGFLETLFAFPYIEGHTFVSAVRERGGPDLLNRVYRDPPRSTEQILHPARYLDERDDPREVAVADLRRALGRGWSQIDGGTLGELDLRVILDGDATHAFLPEQEAIDAAAGWDGGAYRTMVSGDAVVVAVSTLWDSAAEAAGFARTVGRWFPGRFGRGGGTFTVGGEDGRGWDGGRIGAGAVVRTGDRVMLVVGSGRAVVERALRAIR